jgi:hypothetical protein
MSPFRQPMNFYVVELHSSTFMSTTILLSTPQKSWTEKVELTVDAKMRPRASRLLDLSSFFFSFVLYTLENELHIQIKRIGLIHILFFFFVKTFSIWHQYI